MKADDERVFCINGPNCLYDLFGLGAPVFGLDVMRFVSYFKKNVLGVGRFVPLGDLFPQPNYSLGTGRAVHLAVKLGMMEVDDRVQIVLPCPSDKSVSHFQAACILPMIWRLQACPGAKT